MIREDRFPIPVWGTCGSRRAADFRPGKIRAEMYLPCEPGYYLFHQLRMGLYSMLAGMLTVVGCRKILTVVPEVRILRETEHPHPWPE